MSLSTPRTWLITGASRGLGRAFAEVALEAGDSVIATARTVEQLDDLVAAHPDRALALALDVTQREAVNQVVAEAARFTGRLDVLVNNAGYGLAGGIEEASEQQVRTSSRSTSSAPCGAPRRSYHRGVEARRLGPVGVVERGVVHARQP